MLKQFIASFEKAVSLEMEAMRRRMGPFEVPLGEGEKNGDDGEADGHLYEFRILLANEKLVPGAECSLVTAAGSEHLVEIAALDRDRIVVRCGHEIDLASEPIHLVIYPWFLYEKLQLALQSLTDADRFHTHTALQLFGREPARALGREAQDPYFEDELNGSQRDAIRLSCERTPAFVWGPPGTGKTTTLGCIITTLLQRGKRILVTSTTNAAIDQALARFAELEPGREALERGDVVRIGPSQVDLGAGVREVVARLNALSKERLAACEERQVELRRLLGSCDELLSELESAAPARQLGLFGEAPESAITPHSLGRIFSSARAEHISQLEIDEQKEILTRRRQRLRRCRELGQRRVDDLRRELRDREAGVVDGARVLFATMTNVYISRLMESQRFDAVIVEEAGMAVLPTLFYCAALASDQVIMVGDPQQLPPIVQSREPYVHRAMGRSIFAVTVPKPHDSKLVVMLDTQYRMHPRIGDLVGELFYDGRLRHGESTEVTINIAAAAPYPGEPLVLVDTQGQTRCATREGSYSRYNEETARVCLDLALEAVTGGIESIAIITPYAEQSRLIRSLLSAERRMDDHVECRTVHRFQGGERDMVILDTVDAQPLSPGVLLSGKGPSSSARNLINVSISRARGKLVIVADVEYFRQHDAGSIISDMLRRATAAGTKVMING